MSAAIAFSNRVRARDAYTGATKMANQGREIEVKLRVRDIAALRRQLHRLRAKALPRVFERNILYDTPTSDLRESGKLLRIRIETPSPIGRTRARRANMRNAARSGAGSRGILTYKAPISTSVDASSRARYKEREEIEVEFHPADSLDAIFAALALRPGFRYEKFRSSYRLRTIAGLHLDLDETPIGNFLELEGSPAAIDRAARILGFALEDYITGTYWDLYIADCRGRNITPGDLVFKTPKK
jgi:adenylate cyclase class 2